MNHGEIAASLLQAEKTKSPLKPFSTDLPSFTLEQGYEVQSIGLEMRLAEGAKLVGYKMGLTSRAKQIDVNVHEAIRGYLLQSMEVMKGASYSVADRIHPRVEPELAVVLKSPLEGKLVTLREVIGAIGFVGPGLEILDSRFEAFSFKLPDVVADNTSACGFMVGRNNWADRISEVGLFGVHVKKNGEILETGAPMAVLGDPILSVVELVRGLARDGKRLEAGQIVLTGGITTSVSFAAGDSIEVVWPGETLSFRAV